MRGRNLIFLAIALSLILLASAGDSTQTNTTPANLGKDVLGKVDMSAGDILAQNITIPESLSIIIGPIFGIKGVMSWQMLIIMISFWIMIFLVVLNVTNKIPLLNKNKFTSILSAIIFIFLISISGAVKELSNFYLGFKFLSGKYSLIKIFIGVFIMFAFILFGLKVLDKFQKKQKIKLSEELGNDVNKGIKSAQTLGESMSDLSNRRKL